jgi:murein DD-endopeptidase MepM/ murein hydrolase activator NlpD
MKKRSFWQKAGEFLNGKGFYMVLALCLCAIGLSGWYLWQTIHMGEESLTAEVSGQATVTVPEDGDQESQPPAEPEAQEADDQAQTLAPEDEVPSTVETMEDSSAEAAQQTAQTAENDDSGTETGEQSQQPADSVTAPQEDKTAVESSVETVDNLETGMEKPVSGGVLSAFSMEELVYNEAMGDWRSHNGVDLAANVGDEVHAVWAGQVTSVQPDALLGATVSVDCGNGYTVYYSNLAETLTVSAGDQLTAGQVLGTVGNTAAGEGQGENGFLHLAVTKDGEYVDPMDFLQEDAS